MKGLYAITQPTATPEQLIQNAMLAIKGGARVIQYRDKSTDDIKRTKEANALLALCTEHQVPLIINDDYQLAARIGADGVHLGTHDSNIALARQHLGTQAIIGVSCYNDFSLAEKASAEGADYVAFGSFFSSSTKPEAVPASIDLLRRAKSELTIPTVAIGGITPDNASPLIEAGADMLAVVQAVFAQPDIQKAAAKFAALYN